MGAEKGSSLPGAHGEILELLHGLIAEYEHFAAKWRKHLDLSANEYLVLIQLAGSGPLTSAELSRRIGITTASMASLVAGLEREQLVRRVADPDDGRRVLLYLSKRAIALNIGGSLEVAHELQAITATSNKSELQAIVSFLRQASATFRKHAQSLS